MTVRNANTLNDTWVRGDRLSPVLRAQVLTAYVHRHTVENAHRVPAAMHPSIALITDEVWLRSYCFKVTSRGTLDKRTTHCEPAYFHNQ